MNKRLLCGLLSCMVLAAAWMNGCGQNTSAASGGGQTAAAGAGTNAAGTSMDAANTNTAAAQTSTTSAGASMEAAENGTAAGSAEADSGTENGDGQASSAAEPSGTDTDSQDSDSTPAVNEDGSVSMDVFAMDTYMTLRVWGNAGGTPDADASVTQATKAVQAAADEIHRLDALLSTGSADSEIGKINADGGGSVSEDTEYLIRRSLALYQETDGAFDIAIYPIMQLWGFPTQDYRVPSREEILETLPRTDASRVKLDEENHQVSFDWPPQEGAAAAQTSETNTQAADGSSQGMKETADGTADVDHQVGMEIDLGGIAKGYTSARIMEIFRNAGIETALVSLGGNVQTLGVKTDGSQWRVAIEDPDAAQADGIYGNTYLGILECSDKAVITSGAYERYFEQDGKIYHHIIDPSTGYPADSGIKSSTIVSGDGTLADGLSTSLFIMGLEKAQAFWKQHSDEFDFILETDDGTLYVTEGIADALTTDHTVEIVGAE